MKNYRIAILMMLKNESDLALPWVKYHGSVFGYENLFIFDNGSDDKETLAVLEYAKKLGAQCRSDKSTFDDFKAKGEIFSQLIKELDNSNPYDFYFPLDCDEFLSAKIGEKYVFELHEISEALAPYENSPDQLKIGTCPTNNPLRPSYFKNASNQRKFFFAKGSCQSLDHGFHHGITRTGVTVQTDIAYFHFHYRDFKSIQYHAKKKLTGLIENFERDTIKNFRGSGFHLTQYLLQSETEYLSQFDKWDCEYISSLEIKLASIGIALPYSKDPNLIG